MKVVINAKFGGFDLSHEAYLWLMAHGVPALPYEEQTQDPMTGLWSPASEDTGPVIRFTPPKDKTQLDEAVTRLTGLDYRCAWFQEDYRDDPLLVQCVEELGDRANGRSSKLKVVEIPDGVNYVIEEYEGYEHIAEKHRTWG